jgi:hypothetical protein
VRRIIVIALSIVGICGIVLIARDTPANAAGPTPECGNLVTTAWTLAGSPYVICNTGATVLPTSTLTIQPGVVVQINAGGVGNKLNVQGSLTAIGTGPLSRSRLPAS